ncbi:MAG TPA: YgiT-type zinc finger protein [Chloroflexota bacterium]|jgi:YgiT-type zinc finger domain-containing protein|nr:YgiT-type zinc finger protein [Chloroflexota bacterium]
MGEYEDYCTFCMATALEPTTITMEREVKSVKITVEGVPATHCRSCGETGVSGKIAFPIDEAMVSILTATGATVSPTPDEIATLRADNLALAQALKQKHLLADEPTEEPSSATTRA